MVLKYSSTPQFDCEDERKDFRQNERLHKLNDVEIEAFINIVQ